MIKTRKLCIVTNNVLKPDPNTEPNNLPDHWVTRSTMEKPLINKLINFYYVIIYQLLKKYKQIQIEFRLKLFI